MRFAITRPSATLAVAFGLLSAAASAHSHSTPGAAPAPAADMSTNAPSPDPRVGLKAGLWDAGQAAWNVRLVSTNRPTGKFLGSTNSDLAFTGHYVIQGSYSGFQIWDVSDPSHVKLRTGDYCPDAQSDVSVFKNLLFVSGEGTEGRLDCGAEGPKDTASAQRLRGIRIFDISDLDHPKNVANVQTCRGSHTHTLVTPPNDPDNVYIYVSGSAPLRPAAELAGCVSTNPEQDPNSALFRIEIIKVPVAHPEQAAVVSSAHVFEGLEAVKAHGVTAQDEAHADSARAQGKFVANIPIAGIGPMIIPDQFANHVLDSIVKARGGTGAPTAQDSAALRSGLPAMVAAMMGEQPGAGNQYSTMRQCHDITVYPQIGLAGGACEGYGMLFDISDVAHPRRLDAVSDSNFSYWHSATFNNAGSKLIFSDEWGGGSAPKCRKTDPPTWGADAIFDIQGRQKLDFQNYYKMPAPQTPQENCVAHNGSLIPIPGRDVMVQAWYQGGISIFDFTDATHPKEIAFFDRGPIDSTRMVEGGEWSAYWYNGHIYGSEIARGLDIWDLVPSGFLSQNEINAAKSVQFPEYNVQDQQKFVWPATYSLAAAYVDQLERAHALPADRIASIRASLALAQRTSSAARQQMLAELTKALEQDVQATTDAAKLTKLAGTVRELGRTVLARR
jgi:hypothetical protein